jgi:hypothetical protein
VTAAISVTLSPVPQVIDLGGKPILLVASKMIAIVTSSTCSGRRGKRRKDYGGNSAAGRKMKIL